MPRSEQEHRIALVAEPLGGAKILPRVEIQKVFDDEALKVRGVY